MVALDLRPAMLGALLTHELVAGHAAMMKLSAKLDRWLALMSDDRLPEDQDRGARESVRLAVAASRLTERYRLGLLSLARLKGWDGAAAQRRRRPAADPFADLDDDPHDGPDGDADGAGASRCHLLVTSAFIPSDLRSSAVNPSPATARHPRSERPSFARRSGLHEGGSTPCPATTRTAPPRRAAG